MSPTYYRRPRSPVVAAVALAAFAPVFAVNECLTANCSLSGTPAACSNRAPPRTSTVLLGSGGLVFTPANPKIEPGDCIIWRAATSTHSSSGNACPTSTLCNLPAPPACQWETANVSAVSAPPTATCFYDPASFPAVSADQYYCRIHATPTTGTMRGTLQITTPIQLTVGKDLATSSVKLNWTGGGVTGDLSYKVSRQNGGDPKFLTATTVNPDGGVLGTTFTEAGDLGNPTTRYYLVRNKQTNEP